MGRLNKIILSVVFLLAGGPALASREVTDELGRRVTVPDQPRRVICLAPSVTETVFALGSGEAVVGVSNYTEFPPDARTKPSVGDLLTPSIERILALRPDLVFAMHGINRRETVEQIEQHGIPVFVVNPQSLRGVLSAIRFAGDALNRKAEAGALVHALEKRAERVRAAVQGLARPSVFVVIWYDPVITSGGKAFITELIWEAGGKSATADIPRPWPQISMEEVLRRAPQYLLLTVGSHRAIKIEELKARGGWNELEAVREKRIIYVSDRLFHPSPVVFEALEELALRLHPEAFRSGNGCANP